MSQAQRRQLAVDLFNHVWKLLEQSDRTPEQDDEMIHARTLPATTGARSARRRTSLAVSGRSRASTPYSAARSRRSTTLTAASRTSRRGTASRTGISPFAFEAIARAEALAGNTAESLRYELMAREAGEGIADDEDRDHLLSELGTLPGAKPRR